MILRGPDEVDTVALRKSLDVVSKTEFLFPGSLHPLEGQLFRSAGCIKAVEATRNSSANYSNGYLCANGKRCSWAERRPVAKDRSLVAAGFRG